VSNELALSCQRSRFNRSDWCLTGQTGRLAASNAVHHHCRRVDWAFLGPEGRLDFMRKGINLGLQLTARTWLSYSLNGIRVIARLIAIAHSHNQRAEPTK
jgi:hypothetical protein